MTGQSCNAVVSEGSESEGDSTDGEEDGDRLDKKQQRKRRSGGHNVPFTMDQLADAEVIF